MSLEYEQARDMLEIDPDQLGDEMVEAPEILAYLVNEYAEAEQEYLRARFNFEREEARLQMVYRERLKKLARIEYVQERKSEKDAEDVAKAAGLKYKRADVRLKSPTLGEIQACVIQDDDFAAAKDRYIDAEVAKVKAKGWCDVGRVKRDMLTSIGLRVNAEMRVHPLAVAQARGQSPAPTSSSPPVSSDDPSKTPF